PIAEVQAVMTQHVNTLQSTSPAKINQETYQVHDHEHYHILHNSPEQSPAFVRLLNKKKELLNTGAYNAQSDIIKQIEERILRLMQEQKS
ncbi:hypothetical protein, partial [Vibrio parahaemolyticus]|uniref:hypothetical protein n=1 Tax=Vibrio parahaemolyticus TaxID=670 RepID=UPI001A90120E